MLALLLVLLSSPFAKTASDFICGSSAARTAEVLALDQYRLRKFGYAAAAEPLRVSNDQGHISVIEDDGTLIVRPNNFDLAGLSVTFAPAAGTYSVVRSTAVPFDEGAGSASIQNLGDDDSVRIVLPFPFAYFGRTYDSVFLNTDGNLTFGEADRASTGRDLQRMIGGQPRIAPLLDDLNPVSPGRVTVEKFPDRILFNWIDTGEWVTAGARGRNTFQAVLFAGGAIRFTYTLTMDAQQGVVGISPGGGASTIDLVDLSEQERTAAYPGLIAEVFATKQAVSLAAVSQYFYRSHPDVYDFVMVFSDFNLSLDSAFAFTVGIRNDIRGIITADEPLFDRGRQFGSPSRLQAMSNMGSLSNYPLDPRRRFLGENSALSIVSHEFGHRWLAFMDTRDSVLLGRQKAHWSYFNNTSGSFMEGNEIQDLGAGRFRTVGAVYRYSPLDQYIMGLRAAAEVPPWFVVTEPRFDSLPSSFTSGCREGSMAACNPYVGLDFSGVRRDVRLDEMVGIAGARVPQMEQASKVFRVAFILLTQKGQTASASSVAKLDGIRVAWESYFRDAVDGRGTVMTDLVNLRTISTRFDDSLPPRGSRRFATLTPDSGQRSGFARAESAFGTALLRTFAGSSLRNETEVPASTAATSFLSYVETANSVNTRFSIVNPGTAPAAVSIQFSSGSRTTLTVPAGSVQSANTATLLDAGSGGFSGTATIRSDIPVAVTVYRETIRGSDSIVVTNVPMTSVTETSAETSVFPQIVDGAGYSTELILLNPAAASIGGTIDFSTGSRVSYQIPAGGMWRMRTANAGRQVQAGFASIIPAPGSNRPIASAILDLTTDRGLEFQAGVPAQVETTRAAILGTRDGDIRTALAVVNRSAQAAGVRLTAYDQNGDVVNAITVPVAAQGHLAAFLDELMTLPGRFQGTVTLDSQAPVHAITLRTRIIAGAFSLTSMPVVDLNKPPSGPFYFADVAASGQSATEIFLMNIGTAAFRLQTFGTDGNGILMVQQ